MSNESFCFVNILQEQAKRTEEKENTSLSPPVSGAVTEALQQPAVVPRGQRHVSNLDPDLEADLDNNMSADMTVS